ncbi:hypothetical protein SB7C_12250, partial [Staphylococcus epidermidis]
QMRIVPGGRRICQLAVSPSSLNFQQGHVLQSQVIHFLSIEIGLALSRPFRDCATLTVIALFGAQPVADTIVALNHQGRDADVALQCGISQVHSAVDPLILIDDRCSWKRHELLLERQNAAQEAPRSAWTN